MENSSGNSRGISEAWSCQHVWKGSPWELSVQFDSLDEEAGPAAVILKLQGCTELVSTLGAVDQTKHSTL